MVRRSILSYVHYLPDGTQPRGFVSPMIWPPADAAVVRVNVVVIRSRDRADQVRLRDRSEQGVAPEVPLEEPSGVRPAMQIEYVANDERLLPDRQLAVREAEVLLAIEALDLPAAGLVRAL